MSEATGAAAHDNHGICRGVEVCADRSVAVCKLGGRSFWIGGSMATVRFSRVPFGPDLSSHGKCIQGVCGSSVAFAVSLDAWVRNERQGEGT